MRAIMRAVMGGQSKFNALVVKQWLPEWDAVAFDEGTYQSRPLPNFLVTTMPASVLRQLSNTYRRTVDETGSRREDTGIQRKHDPSRSDEISRYVKDGYPLSGLSSSKRATASENLRKPGWLPSAIIVNILDPETPRAGKEISSDDALRVQDPSSWERGGVVSIELPSSWGSPSWQPSQSHPIEVIDGQHRLWSFDGDQSDADFDLPVVAFYGLDISWQAYLFWTVNIKPKKINASLAYDLYPLLRDQDWLIAGEGIDVYRETRAQELTEVLWSHDDSPWKSRINMLGETGRRSTQPVTQAAFVRSLSESLVRPWRNQSGAIGGLFGGAKSGTSLDWSRTQQAAFLVEAWRLLRQSVNDDRNAWSEYWWGSENDLFDEIQVDRATPFESDLALLGSDQGIRAFHQVLNDMTFVASQGIGAKAWTRTSDRDQTDNWAISEEIDSLRNNPVHTFLVDLAKALSSFDWRNAKHPELDGGQKLSKQALRGTGGYKLLRDSLLKHVVAAESNVLSTIAGDVLDVRQ